MLVIPGSFGVDDHVYVAAPLAVSVTVFPTQIEVELAVILILAGSTMVIPFCETCVPLESTTDTEYVPGVRLLNTPLLLESLLVPDNV